MRKINVFCISLVMLLTSLVAQAQNTGNSSVEMADLLYQNGKIYLVVLVLLTIFAGIIFLLIQMERRIKKLEKKYQSGSSTPTA